MKRLRDISRIEYQDNYMIEPCDRYIGWGITKNCTFNCRYCIYSCKNTNEFSTKDQLTVATTYFNNISTDKSWIAIYGGEPLTHPHFLHAINNYKYNVKLYTNLYRDISYLQELIASCNSKLRVLTSFHPHITNIKQLDQKITILLNAGATVEVKCMFTGEDDELSFKAFEYFNSVNIPEFRILPRTIYSILPGETEYSWYMSELFNKARKISGKDLLFKYTFNNGTSEIHDKYDLQFNDSNINDYTRYKMLICEAGNKYISVLDNFNIYPCCRYDEDFYNQKPLGNVLTNPYYDFKNQICKLPFCFPPEEDFLLSRKVL